jgi:murein DD-endopeptidase MepM/ murein hydrolase activator NlpD
MDGIQFKNISAHPIVPFENGKDRLLALDFTDTNTDLAPEVISDTAIFSNYITDKLTAAGATYGIGGYDEHRTVYSRSKVFDAPAEGQEPRRLHLGVDIWGKAGTPVFAPLNGVVHSFAFNDHFGDYGATIILSHPLPGPGFHSLYGHLSLKSLDGLSEGKTINAGDTLAWFGEPAENGHWPPHLHFQLIIDMEGKKGDYPGVCKFSEREKYLANCPNPEIVLDMMKYL